MRFFVLIILLIMGICQPSPLRAEESGTSKRDLPLQDIFDTSENRVEAQADTVEFLKDENKLIAKNNVILSYQGQQITADYAEVETDTKKAYARGHVVIFKNGTARAQGDEIHYNFATEAGSFPDGRVLSGPWFERGQEIQQVKEGVKRVTEGGITSCNLKKPHYELRAKKITVYDGDKAVCRNVTFHILGKPVFWLPIVTLPLQDNSLPFSLSGGYNSRYGYFVRAKKGFSIIKQVWGDVMVDWRSKRGFGAGTDIKYDFGKAGYGDIKLYLTQDKKSPRPGHGYEELEDRERGRATWRHRSDFDAHTHIIGRYNRVADEFFMQDFFQKESRAEIDQPSFVTLTKNGDRFGSMLHVAKQTNRFEALVEKLPYAQLDWKNQPFLSPWAYYESQLSYGNLIKQHGYSPHEETVNRVDNVHEWSTPLRWKNFKFKPRAGVRGTYYSRELESDEDHFRIAPSWGADLRTQYYKLYPASFNKYGIEINQLRHVFEPSIQYEGVRSTVSDEKLQYFDEIDRIDDSDAITFGLENRIQTKRMVRGRMQRVDVVSFNTFLSYEFNPDARSRATYYAPFTIAEHTQSGFSTWSSEVILRPYHWLQYQLRYDFDLRESDMRILNQDIVVSYKKFRFNAGHRYVIPIEDISSERNPDGSNQFVFNGKYDLNKLWDLSAYLRWDPKDDGLEEWQLAAVRDLHDFDLIIGYNERDSDIDSSNKTIFIDLRLKAYPVAHISAGNNVASFAEPRIGETVAGSDEAAPVYSSGVF